MTHHDVNKQIRLATDVCNSFLVWANDKTYANRQAYVELKNKMNDYQPDPKAKF